MTGYLLVVQEIQNCRARTESGGDGNISQGTERKGIRGWIPKGRKRAWRVKMLSVLLPGTIQLSTPPTQSQAFVGLSTPEPASTQIH